MQHRRHFLNDCGLGLGSIALAGLLNGDASAERKDPLAPKAPHFKAPARSDRRFLPGELDGTGIAGTGLKSR